MDAVQEAFATAVQKRRSFLRRAFQVKGPHGVVAVARIGGHCWRVDLSTGESPGACLPTVVGGSIWVDLVQPAGRDLFVIGHTQARRVQLEFANGDVLKMRPVKSLFVFAVPKSHLTFTRQVAFVRSYPMNGLHMQSQSVVFKLRR